MCEAAASKLTYSAAAVDRTSEYCCHQPRFPTAQLKASLDASNATVQKALQLLKDEHLVVGR
ncbi:hypothetical protein GCM10010219_29950 [Streptomyces netropsis]|nr:hypothetical protein GCM10010219_29950 [Streptomyces netropsis]